MHPAYPVLVNRYELLDIAGQGGQGTVYRARDRFLGQDVAVKLLSPLQEDLLESFRWEVAALRTTPSPGAVRLRDEGWAEDRYFVVMDWVDGTAFPGVPTPAPWSVLAPRVAGLLAALARLHSRGMLHCDLKPQNVLVDDAGTVTIVDLGMSRWQGRQRQVTSSEGTLLYCAPEQLDGTPLCEASDLYAVGLLIVEALTGRLPGDPQNTSDILETRLQDAGPLAGLAGLAPEPICEMVDRLLRVDPDQRPRSAMACLSRLHPHHTSEISLPAGARLTPQQLATIFLDPMPALRCAARGAAALWVRTGGVRERVEAELQAWRQLGLLHPPVDGRATLTWRALDELATPRGALGAPLDPEHLTGLPDDERAIMKWLSVMAPFPGSPLLLRHSHASASALAQLQERGFAHEVDGVVWDLSGGAGRALASPAWRAEAQQLLLQETTTTTPGRLALLLELSDPEPLAIEVEALATRALRAGHPDEASALLWTLAALLPSKLHLLAVESALMTDSELYTRQVSAVLGEDTEPTLRRLLDAALEIHNNHSTLARELLGTSPPADDTRRLLWTALHCKAVRHHSLEAHEAFLSSVEPWATTHTDPSVRSRFLGWCALLAYRQADYPRAVKMHRTAAEHSPPHLRAGRLLNACGAALEHGDFETVRSLIAEIASHLSETPPVIQLLWLRLHQRMHQYRSEAPGLVPDPSYVDIAREYGHAYLEGSLALNEAIIAWRAGLEAPSRRPEMWSQAALLARRARQRLEIPNQAAALLAAALLAACTDAQRATRVALHLRARECPLPALRLQILALLDQPAMINPRWLMSEVQRYPEDDWTFRREVFSLNEVLDRLE